MTCVERDSLSCWNKKANYKKPQCTSMNWFFVSIKHKQKRRLLIYLKNLFSPWFINRYFAVLRRQYVTTECADRRMIGWGMFCLIFVVNDKWDECWVKPRRGSTEGKNHQSDDDESWKDEVKDTKNSLTCCLLISQSLEIHFRTQ